MRDILAFLPSSQYDVAKVLSYLKGFTDLGLSLKQSLYMQVNMFYNVVLFTIVTRYDELSLSCLSGFFPVLTDQKGLL